MEQVVEFFNTYPTALTVATIALLGIIFYVLNLLSSSIPQSAFVSFIDFMRESAKSTPHTWDDEIVEFITGPDGKVNSVEEAIENVQASMDEKIAEVAQQIARLRDAIGVIAQNSNKSD